MKRKPALDILRVIATVLIVFHHYNQVMGDAPGSVFSFYNNKFYFGYMVELFFILSGYLSIGYQGKIEKGLSYGSFIGKKALRLMPLVVISSVAYYAIHVLYVVVNKESWLGVYPYVTDIVINSLGIQAGWFFNANYCNYPLWYISVLLLCYSLYYLLTWLGHKTKIPKELYYSVTMLIGASIMILYGAGLINTYIPFANTFSARGFLCFFMGVLIALIQAKMRVKNYIWFFASSVVFLLIVLINARGMIGYFSLVLGFAVLILLFSSDRVNSLINWSAISVVARATIYVYALHLPILMLFVVLRDVFLPGFDLRSNIFMVVFTGIMFFLAFIINHIVEGFKNRKKSNFHEKHTFLDSRKLDVAICRIPPKYYWIVSALLGSAAMFLMLSYSQMLTSGKYVILGGDAWEIYVANIRMIIRNITHGETIWYSFTTSMGYNTALTVAFELLSPFNILFLIFQKVDPNIILAIIIIAKVGTAAGTFQLFSSRVLGNNRIMSIVFAVFYSMCAFTVEYCITNFMWLDGVYMLPIVAWATYVAVKKNKYCFLSLSYAYIFIVQFYMGYLLAGFSFLMYFLLLFLQRKEERKESIGKSLGMYAASAVSAIAISAFVWMPVLSFLVKHMASDSTQFASLEVSILEVLNNLFWGEFQDMHSYPYVYCGIPCVILLPFYFINKSISKREKITVGVLLGFFVLGCIFLPVYKLLHAFDAPDMWNYRFAFVISFLLCVIAVRQSAYIINMDKRILALYVLGLLILYGIEQILQPYKIGWVARNNNNGLIINAALVFVWSVLLYFYTRYESKRTTISGLLLMLTVAEVVANGCVRTFDSNWKQGLTKEDYYYAWERETLRNLELIDEYNQDMSEDEFYRVCILGDAMHNGDAFWGYYGITDFNSAENESLRTFMHDMGFYTSPRRTGGTGLTPSMEMILSVKDCARLYVDLSSLGIQPDLKVYENDYYLPIGYMVNNDILEETENTGNCFENQNILISKMSGVDRIFERVLPEQISMEGKGLVYSEEDNTFYLLNPNGGTVTFNIREEREKVFLEVEPIEKGLELSGLEWGTIMNRANDLDFRVSVPFAAETISAGKMHTVSIQAFSSFEGAYQTKGIHVYSLNEAKLKEAYDCLSSQTLKVEKVKSGYIKGRVSASGTKNVLFTSVPYTDGWSVMLNGTNWEITPVCNGAFCAVILPGEGEYEIEMKYTCPGAARGLWITIAGIALFAATTLSQRLVKAKSTKPET